VTPSKRPSAVRPRTARYLRRGLLALLGILAGCLLFELTLRIVSPPPGFRALAPGVEFRFDVKTAPGVHGPSRFHINSMGVRGREWAADRDGEFRVLCMGGSTTECIVTDQETVWTSLLEQRLGAVDGRRAWIGNIGRSGIFTDVHVLQARELLDVYDPDAMTLLVGINDLCEALCRSETFDLAIFCSDERVRRMEELAFAVVPPWANPGHAWNPLRCTHLWTLLHDVKFSLRVEEAMDSRFNNVRKWQEQRAAGSRRAALPDLGAALAHYEKNVREIIELARRHDVKLLLMTQPVLWRADLTPAEDAVLWMGGTRDLKHSPPGTPFYAAGALADGMDAYNRTLLRIAAETGTACLDLAAVIPKSTTYFFDDCHFTDAAQPLIADVVAAALQGFHPRAPVH
jgi:lysophospholipase L1-like esterase